VLHPDKGTTAQLDRDCRAGHLPRSLPAPEPRYRCGALDHRADRAAGAERRAVQVPPWVGAELAIMATATAQHGSFGRTPYYVVTGGLAIIFLFPLLWTVVASVSPMANTGQLVGYGLGNYSTLYVFGAGLPRIAFNSFFMSVMTVIVTIAL